MANLYRTVRLTMIYLFTQFTYSFTDESSY